LLLPDAAEDGETYVFTKAAAEAMGVAECTVSQWRRRGYLEPVPGSPPRKPLYRLSDVRRAEKLTRDNAIRVSGSDRQVQRMRGAQW
jgi:predicted site-specific integrase-resolvase